MSEDLKTYLIVHENKEETQVDVPANWKVTFGPAVIRGAQKGFNGQKMPMALRFYESDTKQRAIFTDVVSFRDMSIPIRVKKKSTQSKDGFIQCDGVKKATQFRATVEEWVNPDEPKTEMPLLPTDEEIFDLEEE